MTGKEIDVILFVTGYLAGCLAVMLLLWPFDKK